MRIVPPEPCAPIPPLTWKRLLSCTAVDDGVLTRVIGWPPEVLR